MGTDPTSDFSDLAIPFGMRVDGTLVGAAEVGLTNGLGCQCVCPKCNARLVARNQGEHNRPHFAHEASVVVPTEVEINEREPCVGAKETSIHLMAKQIIAGNFSVRLPEVTATLPPLKPRVLHTSAVDLWHKLDNVRLEVWYEGFRPDIVAAYAGQVADGRSRPFAVKGNDVAIEIVVTHASNAEKIEKLRQKELAAIEIDISRERYTATAASLRELINKAPRIWLYHPMIEHALSGMRDEFAVMAAEARLHGASGLSAAQVEALLPNDPAERLRIQLDGLRKYDAAAWRRYNFNDSQERAVMEETLRQRWPRLKH